MGPGANAGCGVAFDFGAKRAGCPNPVKVTASRMGMIRIERSIFFMASVF